MLLDFTDRSHCKVAMPMMKLNIDDFTSQISDKLGSPITTGSFGEVYRCIVESSMGKTEVAVKVFKLDPKRTMEKLTKAILRELQVWFGLKHRTIVPLLGTARVESPLLALVSHWMPSGTLSVYLDEQATTITPSARIKLVKGVAEGLDYLHSEGVIHGDLHPGNVLIDGSGNPCLTDFGLATVAEDPELQWTTTTAGRNLDPRWRAAEVNGIDSDPVRPTFKSDIYSFGSVMFFIVSGDIPWKEKKYSNPIIIELSKKAFPARPCNILSHHWNLIEICWSWEPSDRPDATMVLNLVQITAKKSWKIVDDSTSQQSLHPDMYHGTSSNTTWPLNAYSNLPHRPSPEDTYHNPNSPHGTQHYDPMQATHDDVFIPMRRDFSPPHSPLTQSPNSHAQHYNFWQQDSELGYHLQSNNYAPRDSRRLFQDAVNSYLPYLEMGQLDLSMAHLPLAFESHPSTSYGDDTNRPLPAQPYQDSQPRISRAEYLNQAPPTQPYQDHSQGQVPHQGSPHHDTSRSYTQEAHLLPCRWLNEDNVYCEFCGPLNAMKRHLFTMHLSGPPDAQMQCRWAGCNYSRRGQPAGRTLRRACIQRHVYEMHLHVKYPSRFRGT